MKNILIACLLFIFTLISCQKSIDSNPKNHLNSEQITDFLNQTVRYYDVPPKNVSHLNKFDEKHKEYYQKKIERSELMHYYKADDDFIYFAINRIAPSLKLKKVATIGKLKFENDTIIYYEEIVRTWKMEVSELEEKTKVLFDLIVQGKDVSKYYTKNLPENEYWIEFPDDQTYYDVENRIWKTN